MGKKTSEMAALLIQYVEAGDASGWNNMRYSRTRRQMFIGPVNLAGKKLVGFNLSWCDLRGANFSGADITGSAFQHSSLEGANFAGVKAVEAYFDYADVDDADMSGADFTGASLAGVRFHGVDLSHANFTRATLEEPKYGNLEKAKNVSDANFTDVKYDRI